MSTLFLMMFLASFPAAIAGLINPRWVMPKFVKNPTRKLTTKVYALSGGFSLLFAIWIGLATATPAADLTVTESSPSQLVAASPEAVASPTASPIAAIKTLGVSRAAIQAAFEKPEVGLAFETASPIDGLPTATGKSRNGLTLMQLIGQPENLSEVNLSLFVVADNQRANDINAIYSAGFLGLAVPGWDSPSWLKESLPRLVNGEPEISTVQSGKVIKVTLVKELGLVNISVEPEG